MAAKRHKNGTKETKPDVASRLRKPPQFTKTGAGTAQHRIVVSTTAKPLCQTSVPIALANVDGKSATKSTEQI